MNRTPTQELVLELLTARHRLGEQVWTLAANGTVRRALIALEADGLVGWKSGVVSDIYLAWLTDEGKAECMSPTYTPPVAAETTTEKVPA